MLMWCSPEPAREGSRTEGETGRPDRVNQKHCPSRGQRNSAQRPLVRVVGVAGAKPNLLGYLLHVRLTDPDDRDETNLGNWLWDGGEIKVLLQVLFPVAEGRHGAETQVFPAEVGA